MPRAEGAYGAIIPPEHQQDALLNQAAPVQNTWYTVLDTTELCRLISACVEVQTTGETLEMRITIDNDIYTGSIAAVAGSHYLAYLFLYSTGAILTLATTANIAWKAFLLEGRSIKVEVRKTTAAGAGNLRACVVYATW